MNKLIYFKLELKRNFKLIPQILFGTIALTIVVGAIVFCAGKLLYSTTSIADKKDIVFSSEDNSEMTGLIINTLRQSKSINSVCNIKEAPVDTAISMSKNDETVASIIIPSGFMSSLINGENLPIKIYFSSTKSIFSMVISELSLAAQTTLQCAQSGVYVLHDFYKENNALKYESAANEKLNLIYLGQAFSRKNTFNNHTISSTGSLSLTNYYISSGIMLILLLLGCVFILKLENTNAIISLKLKQRGIGFSLQMLSHVFTTFIIMCILFTIAITSLFAADLHKDIGISINFKNVLINGSAVLLCCSAIICCISNIISNRYSAILLHFILIMTGAFISGAFIPSILLPEALNDVSKFLPTTFIQNTLGNILTNKFSIHNFSYLIIFSIIFFICGIIFANLRLLTSPRIVRKGGFAHE